MFEHSSEKGMSTHTAPPPLPFHGNFHTPLLGDMCRTFDMCGCVPNSLDEVFLLLSFSFRISDNILSAPLTKKTTENAHHLRKTIKKKLLDSPIQSKNNPPFLQWTAEPSSSCSFGQDPRDLGGDYGGSNYLTSPF